MELDEMERYGLAKKLKCVMSFEYDPPFVNGLPNISQMIEFLGDDLWQIHKDWRVIVRGNNKLEDFVDKKELCDALWQAVKYKLNNL